VRRAGLSFPEACARWNYCVDCYRFLRRTRNSSTLFVRFEDLLSGPTATLTSICAYLGVEYHPAMLDGVRSTKLRPEYRNERLDTGKVETAAFPPEYLPLIRKGLQECGYSAD
jgi:hypothetical protein